METQDFCVVFPFLMLQVAMLLFVLNMNTANMGDKDFKTHFQVMMVMPLRSITSSHHAYQQYL